MRLTNLQWFAVGGLLAVVFHAACRVDLVQPEMTFELKGLHVDLTCQDCHPQDQPIGTLPTDCASCHLEDAPENHFGPLCEDCHDEWGWGTAVDHSFLPLENAHELECLECHEEGDFRGLDASCTFCHEDDRPEVSHHAGQECSLCHVPTTWADAVDHSFFPLEESHSTECVDCHANIPDFDGNETDCTFCHEAERPDPDHYRPAECGVCHSPSTWLDGLIDHGFFPLSQSHDLACDTCHTQIPVFTGLSGTCGACHETERPDPTHFPTQDCGDCHIPSQWDDGVVVDHSFFPLGGSHALDCLTCHPNAPDYTGNSSACTACHEQDRFTPTHFLGQDCGECHLITSWADGFDVDHSFFPLTANHIRPCESCHDDIPLFQSASPACSSCHEAERPGADHYPGVDCAGCHGPSSWSGGVVNHSFFPLTQSHDITCDQCHTALPDFTGLSGTCGNCHEAERPSPTHFAGQDCRDCHVPSLWNDGVTVDHSFFPLGASHAVPCLSCHPNAPDYTGNSQACTACHEQDRFTPTHFLGQECDACHQITTWADGFNVDHSFFPVTGNHSRPCEACHDDIPQFNTANPACSSCHEGDRPAPTHFPGQECGGCHNAGGWWDVATISHDFFPLTGNHDQPCVSCHPAAPNDYTGNTSACASCHEGDRPSPTHFAGQDCSGCHAVSAWSDVASVTHDFFPLTGRHDRACATCHVNAPDYTGLSMACESCHEGDRPGCHFTDPGDTCSDCHSYSNTFLATAQAINHAARFTFPVPHHQANLCNECHLTPNSNCDFSCLSSGCHPNESSAHQDVSGFQNNSQTCIQAGCHPDGRN